MDHMNHAEPYDDTYLSDILSSVKTIAMVGASPDKTKFSYGVLRVLHESGYDMIPINHRPPDGGHWGEGAVGADRRL